MWCPSCQSRSPLVAIQPEGLICARCHVEVEFGHPEEETAEGVTLQRPYLSPAAEISAELQLGIADDLAAGGFGLEQMAELQALSLAASAESLDDGGLLTTSAIRRSAVSSERMAGASRYTDLPRGGDLSRGDEREGISRQENRVGRSRENSDSQRRSKLPGDEPLFRFDQAHPPVGGRTKAAIELQRNRSSVSPRSGSRQAGETPTTAPQVGNLAREPVVRSAPVDRSAVEKFPAAPIIKVSGQSAFTEQAVGKAQTGEAPPVVSAPGLRKADVQPAERASAPSEFAIRRVPRSFLLPRSVNRLPGRLCLLSGSLFLAGQSWLLWSFLKSEALGVAGGVLSSAAAFALALYVISRYCDEDLERH